MSRVTFHMSNVTRHMSCATYHVSNVTFFYKVLKLVARGSVINGATLSTLEEFQHVRTPENKPPKCAVLSVKFLCAVLGV